MTRLAIMRILFGVGFVRVGVAFWWGRNVVGVVLGYILGIVGNIYNGVG